MKFGKSIGVIMALSQFLSVTRAEEDLSASTNFCKLDVNKQVSPSCDITFKEINDLNANLRPNLLSLVQTGFFRYFKIDLDKQCRFWDTSDAICLSRNCAVDVVEDWDKLPDYWQPEVLGTFKNDTVKVADENDDELTYLNELCDKPHHNTVVSDYDYCDLDDFSTEGSVLVDLVENPERFTGYGGNESASIWSSIYRENCFTLGESGQSLAKDVFFRIVSGFHASIATHLSNGYLNTDTGNFEPNLDLFMARVGDFPDRIANIYFDYAVVAKALFKIKDYMKDLSFCNVYNEEVKEKFINIVSQLDRKIFNEDLIFADNISSKLKDDFRLRFKNVTRIMDCVHCDRCRMWGKIQTTGYATSLKILFELEQNDEATRQYIVNHLTKYELIALINTFDRLSQAIEAINNFEKLYSDRLEGKVNVDPEENKRNNFFKLVGSGKKPLGNKPIKKEPINKNVENTSEKVKRTEDEQVVFSDIKLPEKKEYERGFFTPDVWRDAWTVEIHNFKEALRFIVACYKDLPRNVWNTCLYTMNKLWNSFIGVANYVPEEDENPVKYKLDLQ